MRKTEAYIYLNFHCRSSIKYSILNFEGHLETPGVYSFNNTTPSHAYFVIRFRKLPGPDRSLFSIPETPELLERILIPKLTPASQPTQYELSIHPQSKSMWSAQARGAWGASCSESSCMDTEFGVQSMSSTGLSPISRRASSRFCLAAS